MFELRLRSLVCGKVSVLCSDLEAQDGRFALTKVHVRLPMALTTADILVSDPHLSAFTAFLFICN